MQREQLQTAQSHVKGIQSPEDKFWVKPLECEHTHLRVAAQAITASRAERYKDVANSRARTTVREALPLIAALAWLPEMPLVPDVPEASLEPDAPVTSETSQIFAYSSSAPLTSLEPSGLNARLQNIHCAP